MRLTLTFAAMLTLAACSGRDPVAPEANDFGPDTVDVLPPDESSAMPTDALSESGEASADRPFQPVPPDDAIIPDQYRGRWGIVAADCSSERGDAKGLITVGDTTIRFYESLATLQERRPSTAISFSGLFSFTGEGERWEKVMTFTRDGDTLVRAEEDGRFTYRRCD